MALLSEEEQHFFRRIFETEMVDEVKVIYFTQKPSPIIKPEEKCQFCEDIQAMWEEITGLSDKLSLEVYYLDQDNDKFFEHWVDKIPASILLGKGQSRLRYFGVFSMREFPIVIEAIIALSKGEAALLDETKEELKSVENYTDVHVYVTPP